MSSAYDALVNRFGDNRLTVGNLVDAILYPQGGARPTWRVAQSQFQAVADTLGLQAPPVAYDGAGRAPDGFISAQNIVSFARPNADSSGTISRAGYDRIARGDGAGPAYGLYQGLTPWQFAFYTPYSGAEYVPYAGSGGQAQARLVNVAPYLPVGYDVALSLNPYFGSADVVPLQPRDRERERGGNVNLNFVNFVANFYPQYDIMMPGMPLPGWAMLPSWLGFPGLEGYHPGFGARPRAKIAGDDRKISAGEVTDHALRFDTGNGMGGGADNTLDYGEFAAAAPGLGLRPEDFFALDGAAGRPRDGRVDIDELVAALFAADRNGDGKLSKSEARGWGDDAVNRARGRDIDAAYSGGGLPMQPTPFPGWGWPSRTGTGSPADYQLPGFNVPGYGYVPNAAADPLFGPLVPGDLFAPISITYN